jgi:hypothetical protein
MAGSSIDWNTFVWQSRSLSGMFFVGNGHRDWRGLPPGEKISAATVSLLPGKILLILSIIPYTPLTFNGYDLDNTS